ncbi:universal stress protein [Pseudomonas nicosulfuronedens]|uniref:universal stress protein n=1 Tax=Pseudomonas nicosulfuronedens TaxID=2571105 RepID=UPI00244ACDCC|nr:universal stress protein [Pseudomonas nicosulfuronedens]MDH1008617.1 universal stress protein [Pseudomonas nicosulfuronedens]MDH1980826.1 universal stress protein [Pseudomonas nicosulfuronedens]MDH2028850.1 universal stress protein [Pseudomonas nicosulfuronedens]
MYQNLLVAHDLSVEADIAVRRAAQLARQHGARVTLLHVIEEFFPDRMMATVREAAEVALRDAARASDINDYQLVIRQGRAANTVTDTVQELNADLLVIGAHHQQLLERFDGTTLERIARHCRTPILLAVDESARPYAKALSGLDLSHCSCRAWRAGYRLLAPDAELLALNAYQPGKKADRADSHLDTQRELLRQALQDERTQVPATGPQLLCAVQQGTPQQALETALREWTPDLLVLGSRSRGAIEQAMLGSSTRYFLRRPPCDVLISQ